MADNYLDKAVKAYKAGDWYQEKADQASTETEREWWAGFARICRGDAEHYAALSEKYEKDNS
jgi:hypothetical protein